MIRLLHLQFGKFIRVQPIFYGLGDGEIWRTVMDIWGFSGSRFESWTYKRRSINSWRDLMMGIGCQERECSSTCRRACRFSWLECEVNYRRMWQIIEKADVGRVRFILHICMHWWTEWNWSDICKACDASCASLDEFDTEASVWAPWISKKC